jgi:hypothetical protein
VSAAARRKMAKAQKGKIQSRTQGQGVALNPAAQPFSRVRDGDLLKDKLLGEVHSV